MCTICQGLATLLKSLYDAVGSSIKLPQEESRTIKLRLSVVPDSAKLQTDAVAGTGQLGKDNRDKDAAANNLKQLKNHDNNKLTSQEKETVKQNNLSAAMEKLNVEVKWLSMWQFRRHFV